MASFKMSFLDKDRIEGLIDEIKVPKLFQSKDSDYHYTIAGSSTTSASMMMNFGECLKDLEEDYESQKDGSSLKKENRKLQNYISKML